MGDLVIHNVEHPDRIYNELQDASSNIPEHKGLNEKDIKENY